MANVNYFNALSMYFQRVFICCGLLVQRVCDAVGLLKYVIFFSIYEYMDDCFFRVVFARTTGVCEVVVSTLG